MGSEEHVVMWQVTEARPASDEPMFVGVAGTAAGAARREPPVMWLRIRATFVVGSRGFARCLGAAAVLAGFIAGTGPARPGHASCNLIPQTTQTFDSVLGATNRPFAGPNEPIELHVRPCDTSSAGISATATDQLVTVLFTPNGGATRNAVVLTAGSCSALATQLTACQTQLGGGQAPCIEGASAGLQIVQRADGPHLQFLFPDTDSFVGTAADALTLAGPATVAVTQTTASSLPCSLATSPAARRLAVCRH